MLRTLKQAVKRIPIAGPLLQRSAGRLRKRPAFITSSQYWQDRYATGGNSGAGSYNRLAEFKSEVLNEFVRENNVKSIIEFGCGDGSQLSLSQYPNYIGVDVSTIAVDICKDKFRADKSKRFFTTQSLPVNIMAEMAISLDVIYHLIEDRIFDSYMQNLFNAALRFVAIYSSNQDNGWTAQHVKHRNFTGWIDQNEPEWALMNIIKNKYPYDPSDESNTSFADFYIFRKLE